MQGGGGALGARVPPPPPPGKKGSTQELCLKEERKFRPDMSAKKMCMFHSNTCTTKLK